MTTRAKTPARPLRRDAQANRDRIVSAARVAFAADGIEVPVEEIARRAAVGMGTLYRHFPAKEDLIDAVLEDAFEEFICAQEQGALRADFTAEDMPLVFWAGGRVIEATAAVAPEFWRRHLGLLLDGLRAEAATPLPHPPLTRAQLNRATGRRSG